MDLACELNRGVPLFALDATTYEVQMEETIRERLVASTESKACSTSKQKKNNKYGPEHIRRFIEILQEEGLSVPVAAKKCKIPRSTAYKLFAEFNTSKGTTLPGRFPKKKANRGTAQKIFPEHTRFLTSYFAAHPKSTLKSAQEALAIQFNGFTVSLPTLWRHLTEQSFLKERRAPGRKTENLQFARVQKPAPVFTAPAVVDGEFKDISLSDYLGRYLVFFWYPMDFTFVCPTEVIAFSDRIEEFKKLNCDVVAASCDSEYAHLAWSKTERSKGGLGKVNIPILADKTKEIAKSYGIYIEEQGISLRGLFIIDRNGIVRQITINDLPVGRSIDETLRLLNAFKVSDENGEVCPANWKSGEETIKPSVSAAEKYFASKN
ncbi:thioredoxin-like protein [Sporodiniella umbellata]|nr:thioredoxin-like protein [Sporodiniella umbellata]